MRSNMVMEDEYWAKITKMLVFNDDAIAFEEMVSFMRREQEFILIVKEADRCI